MAAFWLMQVGPLNNIGSAGAELFDYLKVIVILALLLAIVVIAARVWLPRMAGAGKGAAGPIQVIARLALEPRKSLYIIQAAGDYFLVGTSDSGMHYLTRLDSDRAGAAFVENGPALENEFAAWMKAFRRPKQS